jgi:hypothetical protein
MTVRQMDREILDTVARQRCAAGATALATANARGVTLPDAAMNVPQGLGVVSALH